MNGKTFPTPALPDSVYERLNPVNPYRHLGYTPDAAHPRNIMLFAHLHRRALEAFDRRGKEIAAIKTADAFTARQTRIKSVFHDALGAFPERTPLEPRVVGVIDEDDYVIERVIYESRPGHHVTANLYLPKTPGPVPGVLVPCGHSRNGKASSQKLGGLLARNGLAALVYDPIGQGERNQILTPEGKPVLRPTFEHNMLGAPARLIGRSAAHYRVWDGFRSLDYLASRPEIDPKRIGCTGCSGGGTLTSYLMVLDERIAVAAPVCYLTSYERLLITMGMQDDEQNIPGQFADGILHADYLALRAPKPTLMVTATRDFFDIDGAWDTFREAKGLFCLMEAGDRLDMFESDDPHGFSSAARRTVTRWMRRWLLDVDDLASTEEGTVRAETEVWCTKSGQVLLDGKSRSIIELNVEAMRNHECIRAKRQAAMNEDEFRRAVREKIGLTPPAHVVPVGYGVIAADGFDVTRLCFETEPGIVVPALLYTPGARAESEFVLYVNGDDKSAGADEIRALLDTGRRVLAADLRGFGETAPLGNGYAENFGRDFNEAYLALNLNCPLLGQRVFDLLSVVGYALAELVPAGGELRLIGTGRAAPVALHAAALDTRIARTEIRRGLLSWSAVVAADLHAGQAGNIVHDVLRLYDLPELVGLIAPRSLKVSGAVDPLGATVPRETVLATYTALAKRCEKIVTGKNLIIE